jgi:hypothetical protein
MRGVGLTIAHERGEQGWRSLMKKGSGDGEKLINNGNLGVAIVRVMKEVVCCYFAKRSPSFWLINYFIILFFHTYK